MSAGRVQAAAVLGLDHDHSATPGQSSQAHKFLSFAGTLLSSSLLLLAEKTKHLTGKNIQIFSDGFLIGALCHDNNLFLILLTFEIILTFPPVAAGC